MLVNKHLLRVTNLKTVIFLDAISQLFHRLASLIVKNLIHLQSHPQ